MMSRQLIATIGPSLPKVEDFLRTMLSDIDTLGGHPDLCLVGIRGQLNDALEYLSLFKPAGEVLIPAFTRFERVTDEIGVERMLGHFDADDFVYREETCDDKV